MLTQQSKKMIPTVFKKKNASPMVFALSAFIITTTLFYIDEGYYDLRWANDPFAWIIFAIYSIPIFGFQLLTYNLLPSKTGQSTKYVSSVLIGSSISIALTIGVFYLLG